MKTANPTRPALLRMQRIHEAIAAGKPVNRRTLAAEFETSSKTIQRDIDYLRDCFGLPIAYNPERHTYFYTEPVGRVLFDPIVRPEVIPHGREDGTDADFTMPLDRESHGHLSVICERHGVRAECVLAAIVGETLADAVRDSALMQTIVRLARELATLGREVA